eukprot:comp19903_c0_seq1/m.38696 comp19903_c0_seq1/g.38696  ORF comp19903_c0_seq1/g.38696 comp19903_c0_seq1/m.38696 type:complete len:340 (-) comp19903_c0_seq1:164-1183(-)
MSVAPAGQGNRESEIPRCVARTFTHELRKCLKHLDKVQGFMCLMKGGLKSVGKAADDLEKKIASSSAACKLNGDYLMISDGSEQMLLVAAEKLVKEWTSMKDGLSDKARNAKWPPKQNQKPIPDGIDKKAGERIAKRRAAKLMFRQRYTIVQIGEKYAAYLYQFVKVLVEKELSITAPTFEEFRKLESVPRGIDSLGADFFLEIALSKDIWVQRFVAHNIAMFCIAGANVKKVGEEGMDKLVSLAWVGDDDVQKSCLMASYKVATFKEFHEKPAYNSAMDVLKELAKSEYSSSSVKALAALALSTAIALEAGRDVQDIAGKAVDGVKGALSDVKGFFSK